MKQHWDSRFSNENYVYGEEPNVFIKSQIDSIKEGVSLFPAEGEGRNAVYAAQKSHKVIAFDQSIEGKKKALKLAEKNNVNIEYIITNFDELDLDKKFDYIFLCFAHFLPEDRESYHRKLIKYLKPGGKIILEGFSKTHLENQAANKRAGGPPRLDMLFSKEELASDFKDLNIIKLEYTNRNLDEGNLHKGKADLINLVAEKQS